MAIKDKLIKEINFVLAPKLFNIKNKTATERERFLVQECLGFLSLINYSSLSISEIKKLWDKSNLGFR